MKPWRLKRTTQCGKCPWRMTTNPYDIPDGYNVEKHKALKGTIAQPGDLSGIGCSTQRVMACHEMADTHCVGWLANQLGKGNNIPLRISMIPCENSGEIKTIGKQHERFEDTLPAGVKSDE